MKKSLLALMLTVVSAFSTLAADLTTVWEQIAADKSFITGPADKDKIEKNGFEKLDIAINTAPTSDQINRTRRLAATIDDSQKITSVSQSGVDISIYMAPYNIAGTEYKVLFLITKNDNADKALFVFYGVATQEGLQKALQNFSLEDLVG